jgi:hypothetical protein
MKQSRGIFRIVDRAVLALIDVEPERESDLADRRRSVKDIEHILYDMDVVDSKSAALLTHVSIMLAVIVVLINSSTQRVWQLIMTGELVSFSIVGMLLLRCVDVMGPPLRPPLGNDEELNLSYCREVLIRRAVYQTMVRTVFVLTLGLIVLVAVKSIVFSDTP